MKAVDERYRGIANSAYQVAMQVPWALAASLGSPWIARLSYTSLFLSTPICYILALVVLSARFLIATGPS